MNEKRGGKLKMRDKTLNISETKVHMVKIKADLRKMT